MYWWRGKPIYLDYLRGVESEMIKNGISMSDAIETLEHGVQVRKRKKGTIEKWWRQGGTIVIITVVDWDDYWLMIHTGRITATKNKLRIIREA